MTKKGRLDWAQSLRPTRRGALKIAAGAATATTLGAPATAQRTDRQQWVFETRYGVTSSPTVVDGTVFIRSYDAKLHAVDADTGNQQWAFETVGGGYSSPTVVDGTVFVGSRDGLYAVDSDTGTQQWAFETSDSVYSSPTVVNKIAYVGSLDNNIYAVDVDTGNQKWIFEARNAVSSSPTVADGTVFIGGGINLYALDAETGDQQWTLETGGDVGSSPTVADGTVFVGSGDGELYALDVKTGSEQWRFKTGVHPGVSVDSSPTVVDRMIFVGSNNKNLYAIDTDTGEQQWVFETDGGVNSSPTVAGETVFVGSGDGLRTDGSNLYALDANTGEQQWAFETGGSVYSSPTVVDGTVFVGSRDGNLYAIDADVAGSSKGSRVELGTLGHHHAWADRNSEGEGGRDDSREILIGDTFESNHEMDPYRITTGTSDRFDWGTNKTSLPSDGSYYGYLKEADSGSDTRIVATSNETIRWDQSYTFEFLLRYPEYDPSARWNDISITWRGDKAAEDGEASDNIIEVETFDTDSSGVYNGFGFKGNGVTDASDRYMIEWDPSAWYQIKGYVSETDGVAKAKIWKETESEPTEYQVSADVTTGISTELPYSINIDGRRGAPITLNMAYVNWKPIETESRSSKYTDDEGYVDSEGLLDAGADYRNGEISEDRLSEVASAFRSGEPL